MPYFIYAKKRNEKKAKEKYMKEMADSADPAAAVVTTKASATTMGSTTGLGR